MDIFQWSVIFFLLFSLFLILLASREDPEENSLAKSTTISELRSRQITGFREHAVKQKFEAAIDERVSIKKKYEVEEMLFRAGLNEWSYGELLVTKVGLSIIGLLVSWLFLNNFVITGVTTLTCYILPSQIISMIANKRTITMESDIGTFIQLTTERYKVHGDFQKAVKQCAPDFKGHEPMYSEIRQTILDFNVGTPTTEALEGLAKRTGSKYITQFADYYNIASTLGTESSREKIIGQAWENFNENYKIKKQHELEIDAPKKEAYIIVGALPLMMLYQTTVDDNYLNFFLNTKMGQLGLGIILLVTLGCVLFIEKKVGAPLD